MLSNAAIFVLAMNRRDHYVQRAYLARFSNSEGLIWQHYLRDGSSREISPIVAAVEQHMYSPGVGPDPKDDSIERALAEYVDTPGISVIAALSNGESLSEDRRYQLSLYLAVQERRTPHARDWVCNEVKRTAEMYLQLASMHPEYLRHASERAGQQLSDSEVQGMCRSVLEGSIEVQPTKITWLNILVTVGDIVPIIASLPWLVVQAPRGFEFITSDRPVVKVLTNQRVPRHYAGGWLSPSAEVTFALDPEHILVIRPDGIESRIEGKPSWCRDVNSRTIRQARRFVFSRSNDGFVHKVWNKACSIKRAR